MGKGKNKDAVVLLPTVSTEHKTLVSTVIAARVVAKRPPAPAVAVVVAVLMPVARIMVTATVVGGATVVAVRVARSRVGSRARAPVVAVVTVPAVAAQAALRRVELVVPGVVVVLPLVFDLLCLETKVELQGVWRKPKTTFTVLL